MEKANSQENYSVADLVIPCEGVRVTDLHTTPTSAKDRDFSTKGSLRSSTLKPFDEIDDCLRSAMQEMRDTQPEYISPKLNDSVINDVPTQDHENSTLFEENYAKWRNLTLIAKSIHRFKAPLVERIRSAVNLRKNINSWSPVKRNLSKDSMYVTAGYIQSEALSNFRDFSDFMKCVERGNPKDLAYIKEALTKDPKNNMYDVDSVHRLANKPNHKGYSPLYIACKNGNLQLVKLLLEFKANPLQLCQISPKEKESVLAVAARWGHIEVVKQLLCKQFFWDPKELKKAEKEAHNNEIKTLIKASMRQTK